MSGLASFKHKCLSEWSSEDHCESDVTGNGIEIAKKVKQAGNEITASILICLSCVVSFCENCATCI